MLILGCLIGVYIAAVMLGKRSRRMGRGAYLLLLMLSALQAAIVLIEMFGVQMPE